MMMMEYLHFYEEQLRVEEQLRESEEKYRLLFETAYDGILLIDGLKVVECNHRAAEILGCSVRLLLNGSIKRFIPTMQMDGRKSCDFLGQKRDRVMHGEPGLFELRLARFNTTEFDAELSLNLIRVQGKDMIQAMLRDITDRKNMEEWLRYLNMHDVPTGLYNRNFFEEEMSRLQTGRFDPVGIAMCDVDGLKLVNDNLGHSAGDAVLYEAAQILLDCVRKSDIVARIGGDEFAILMPNCPPEKVENTCARIRKQIIIKRNASPPVPLSMSIGYSVKTELSQNMDELLKEADNLLYLEKPKNRENFRLIFGDIMAKLHAPDA